MSDSRLVRLGAFAAVVAATVLAGAAHAAPWSFVGSRQQAMGGAGVAYTSDSTATYWNPANLAFQKGWGVTMPITANGAIENNALNELSELLNGFDELDALAQSIFSCQPFCPGVAIGAAESQQVANFLTQFLAFGQNGESVHANASLGLAGRYEGFGFSAMSLSTGTIFPNTDLTNLSLGAAVLDLVGAGCCVAPVDQPLANDVFAAAAGTLSAAQAGHFVSLLERAGINTSLPRNREFAVNLAEQGASAGFFADNDTGALLAGLSVQEFALTYAFKLPMPLLSRTRGDVKDFLKSYVHEKFALAVVPKYMLGVTFLEFYRYDDSQGAGDIVSDLLGFDTTQVSHAFGLDVGLSYRPRPWLQFGMMARNVNSPEFGVQPFTAPDGRSIHAIVVEPQVRVGVALVPIPDLTLAFDFDATSNRIITLPGFESRLVSLGAEYDIPISRRFGLAVRLGGYSNVSDSVDDDWAMTGGLGFRFGSFRMDLSAGGSFEDELIRTGSTSYTTFPTRMSAGVGFSWEKSL